MNRKFYIAFLIFLSTNIANAQYFQTGQDPSRIRWRQINTTHFQVIFPQEFENEAQRLAYVLTKVYDYGSKTLNFSPRKISVVLHTQTVHSNGLVAWAPKRMELFTTPHQQIYSQDWLQQLAIHEFRHVAQMDKIQNDLPFILKFLLGEQVAAIVAGAYLPFWFLEGDAVVTETALSKTGRGRLASFSMEYRAQLAECGKYSFDKAYLGSYKDFVPDHYKLGYWMVGKTREKYGPQIWNEAVTKIGKKPFSTNPFNSVLKKETGMNSKQLYNQLFDELANEWKADLNSRKPINLPVLSPLNKSFTSYLYPAFYNDSLVVAYRTSIDDIGRFVLIGPDKRERIIFTPGYVFDESVSVRNQLIIWAERRPDLRWTHADRSAIIIYNIETGVKSEISVKNKLFSPIISPDLQSFAAVEVDPSNRFYLSVFDLKTGEILERFNTTDNQYFFTPSWDSKGEKLYIVSLSAEGKYLASYDLITKEFRQLTSATFGNLKNPVFTGNRIIFSADFSGIDHLYALNPLTRKIFRILEAKYGIDYPSEINSKNQLLFSNYSASGYQVSAIKLDESNRYPEINDIGLATNELAEKLSSHENGIPDFSFHDSLRLPTEKYRKLANLFNFHSWAPTYIDVDSYEIRPGFSVFSQNKLGTAETHLGYDYNTTEKNGKFNASFSYKGFFPELKAEINFGKGATNYYSIINTVNQSNVVIRSDTTIQRYTWNEFSANFDATLPLNLSKGKYFTSFFPMLQYSFNHVNTSSHAPTGAYSGDYHALVYRFYFYHLLHQSSQNLMPRWGQQLDLIFKHTPFIGNDLGTLAGVQSVFYFPGFGINHGIKIYQGYQEKVFKQSHSFSNFIRMPRGIQGYQNNKMYSISADYRMPIFYPDVSLGRLLYLKRVKTSLFYDYAWMSVPVLDRNKKIVPNHHQLRLSSMGIELTSDVHFLRFIAPVEWGVRSIYLPDSSDFRFELLFSIDFNGF